MIIIIGEILSWQWQFWLYQASRGSWQVCCILDYFLSHTHSPIIGAKVFTKRLPDNSSSQNLVPILVVVLLLFDLYFPHTQGKWGNQPGVSTISRAQAAAPWLSNMTVLQLGDHTCSEGARILAPSSRRNWLPHCKLNSANDHAGAKTSIFTLFCAFSQLSTCSAVNSWVTLLLLSKTCFQKGYLAASMWGTFATDLFQCWKKWGDSFQLLLGCLTHV